MTCVESLSVCNAILNPTVLLLLMWPSICHVNEVISIRIFLKGMIGRIKRYDEHLTAAAAAAAVNDVVAALLQLKSFDCNYQNLQSKKKIYSLQPFFIFLFNSQNEFNKSRSQQARLGRLCKQCCHYSSNGPLY